VSAANDLLAGLRALPDGTAPPTFDRGWGDAAFLAYARGLDVNWSDDLEALHEESSRDHFIDVWTRTAMLERLGPVSPGSTIADLGCSTGYLLEDLRRHYPGAFLAGVDMVPEGLAKAHSLVPDAALFLADVCALPFADSTVDAIVSANVLEHVPEDVAALGEMRRVLRAGGRAVIVVPAGPGLYDYYDRFLGHERRYARGELAGKARAAGLEVLEDAFLGSLLYPGFWATKKWSRYRHRDAPESELEGLVSGAIDRTSGGSPLDHVGRAACRAERTLLRRGVRLPAGIRGLTVLRAA
jgi:SAM-dependent methyltransferase